MADKLELLVKANERGLLKGKHKAMYDAAVERGLIKASQPEAEGGLSAAFGAGVDKAQELGYRAAEGLTDVIGEKPEPTKRELNVLKPGPFDSWLADKLRPGAEVDQWAEKGIERNVEEQKAYEPTVKSYKDIGGLKDFGNYAGELVAGSLPYMAAAANPIGAATLAGGLSQEAYEKQPEDEKNVARAVASGSGQMLLERLGIKVSMGQLGKDILKDGVVETAKRMGKGELVDAVRDPSFVKRLFKGAVGEGLTETGQEALAQWGAGKSIDEFEGLDEAFVGGLTVGGVMRTGSETAQKVMGYQQKTAEAVKQGADQLVESGATPEEAIETVKKQQYDSAIKQGFTEVEASAIVARTMKEKFGIDDPLFTAAAQQNQPGSQETEQAQTIPEDAETPVFKNDDIDYDAPTAARQAGFDQTAKAAGQYGDMLTSPAQQSLRDLEAGNNAPTVDERVKAAAFDKSPTPEDRFSPIKYQHEGELLGPDAQNAQGIDNAPIDGQAVPEQGKLPTTEQTRNREMREQAQADLESQPKGIDQKDIIFGEDGRPQQRAAEQVKQAGKDSQNLLPQKDIIFAGNQSGVNVAKNGEAFKTKRDALLSKEARAARRAGHKTKAVSFDNGYGWTIKGDDGNKQDSEQAAAEQSPETDTVAQNEQGDQAQPAQQEGEALSLNVDAAPGKDEDDKNIAVNDKVDGVQVIDTPVSELSLSKDIPQFKSGSNSDGVVEPLTGKFDPVGMSPVQVWVRENGNKEIITGRHRFDLAKRDGVENIPAQYHYESDGFTADDGKRLDAILNIREDKGQVEDYVELFKQDGITEAEAKQYGLLDRATGRTAFKIANSATNETIEAQRTGRISAQAAEAIAEAAPGNERLQILGVKSIADDQRSITFAKNLIHAVSALNTNQDQGGQSGDLFGFDDSAMQEAEQMAKVAAAKQREIRSRLSAIRGAANKPEIAKAEGVNVKNPKALKKRTDELASEVKAWDNWHTNPEMVQQIRDSISAPNTETSAPNTAPVTETVAEPESTEQDNGPDLFGDSEPPLSEPVVKSEDLDITELTPRQYIDQSIRDTANEYGTTIKEASLYFDETTAKKDWFDAVYAKAERGITLTSKQLDLVSRDFGEPSFTQLLNKADMRNAMPDGYQSPKAKVKAIEERKKSREINGADALAFETVRKIKNAKENSGRTDLLIGNLKRQIAGANRIRAKHGEPPIDPGLSKYLEPDSTAQSNNPEIPDSSTNPKKRKVYGWDRVELSKNYTANELDEWIKELSNDPDNQVKDGIYQLDVKTRKKIDELTWAVYYIQKEKKNEQEQLGGDEKTDRKITSATYERSKKRKEKEAEGFVSGSGIGGIIPTEINFKQNILAAINEVKNKKRTGKVTEPDYQGWIEDLKSNKQGAINSIKEEMKRSPAMRMEYRNITDSSGKDPVSRVADRAYGKVLSTLEDGLRSLSLEAGSKGQSSTSQAPVKQAPIESGLDAYDAMAKSISDGELNSAEQIKNVLNYLADNQDSVKAELNKLNKKQLTRMVNGHVWSDTKKAELVNSAYRDMFSRFMFIGNQSSFVSSSSYKLEDKISDAKKHVESLTDQQVAEYSQEQKAKIDAQKERLDQYLDKLKNPQTLDDYKAKIKAQGQDSLTTEQQAEYDRLIAGETIASKNEKPTEKEGLKTGGDVELGEPIEGVHGKTGDKIFNVQVISRLGKDAFKEAANFARSMGGGYYKGNFYFKSIEDAELFSGWVNGETVDTTEKQAERQEARSQKNADKLKAMAEKAEQRASEALNADRKTNTIKRLGEAEAATAKAEKEIELSKIMRELPGSDTIVLKNATQKVQVELLDSLARSLVNSAPESQVDKDGNSRRTFKAEVSKAERAKHARMPLKTTKVFRLKEIARDMEDTKGFVLLGRKMNALVKGKSDQDYINIDDSLIPKYIDYIENNLSQYDMLRDSAANYKRLDRMGISNAPTLRTALIEYMNLKESLSTGKSPSKLSQMERDLQRTMLGNRNAFNDFFPTPESLAVDIAEMADIEPGMKVLEPSAGNGLLADAAKEKGASVDVVEMGGQLREILQEKGHNLVGNDFLEYSSKADYDRIIMNPPFSNDQDIAHVEHAYKMLKPGGKLVAITSSMAGDRSNKTNKSFKEWLDSLDAEQQQLPANAFKSSLNPTGVSTKAIVIEKPAESINSSEKPSAKEPANIGGEIDQLGADLKGSLNSYTKRSALEKRVLKLVDDVKDANGNWYLVQKKLFDGEYESDIEAGIAEAKGALVKSGPTKPNNSNANKPDRPQQSINDFGEKLGGARKDAWSGFSEAILEQQNTAELPLSKSWPEPNYKELAEKGVSAESIALMAAMRSEIPSKPRVARKVARWAEKVNALKSLASYLVSGELDSKSVMQRMRDQETNLSSTINLPAIANAVPAIAKADIDTLKNVSDYRINSGSFSVFGGKKYTPSKTFYFIERKSKPTYEGASENLSDVQALLAKQVQAEQSKAGEGNGAKQSKISVYIDRYTKQSYLGWKGASGVLKIKEFKSTTDARNYLNENRAEVEKTLQKMKDTPKMRKPVNDERIGPERYAGEVTPEIFAGEFGFRGVEFGNWVEQNKRQKDLNQAYDGLMDLAEALDIQPKALSLNGQLGLAFGARGKGGKEPAAAHYEPDTVVINLTKKAGAGSLAHEWWHALDNYFGKQKSRGEFITDMPYSMPTDQIRPEMADAFKHVRNAVIQSGLPERSRELDTRRSKAYWATNIEMTARSFETYIIDKLSQQGVTNDYLANVVGDEAWSAAEALGFEGDNTYPYPNKSEQEQINPAYQSLFDAMESENTNEGIRLFSKSKANKKSQGVKAGKAQEIANNFIKGLNGANGITVNILEDTASAEKLWRMSLDGATVKGAYSEMSNTVYIIAENMDSIDDLKQTLAHETIAHGGLDTVIGKEAKQEFIDRIKKTKGRKAFEKYWKDANKDYWDASEDVKAEEIFARFVENEPSKGEVKYWWNALKRFVRKQLDKLGIVYREDDELTAMRDMLKSIVKGFKAQRESASQRPNKLAYSQSGKKMSKESQRGGNFKGEIDKPIKVVSVKKPISWVIDNIDNLGQSDIESALNQLDSNGDWEGVDSFSAKKYIKSLTSDYSPLEMQVVKNGLTVRDLESVSAELDVKSNNFYSNDFNDLSPKLKDDIVGYLERDGISDYEAHKLSGDPKPFYFSRTTDNDARTAKQKLGLEEQAAQTLSDIAKDKVNNTLDTLKSSPFWNRLNEGIFDGLSGIKNAEEAAGVTDPNRQGYVSARLASGLADVLHGVFNYGAPQWRDGIVQRKEGTKGLLEVFGMVGDDLNNWLAWMGAHRAERLAAEGRENNLTPQDIAELKALANGKERLFEQTRLEYNKVNSAILDMAQQAGLLSEAQRSGFDEEYYVPFFRDMGETDPEMDDIKRMIIEPHTRKGIAGQSAQVKKLKGGKQSTKDLLENIISRQSTFIDASLKNKAMQEVVNNLDGTDYMTHENSDIAKSMTQQQLNNDGKVRVMIDGKPQAYLVSDPALLRALIQVNDVGSQSLFNRLGRSAKRFLTAGITLSPDFIFKNFVRDAAHAWMINKDDFKFGTDSIKGLKKAFKEDEAYRDLIFSGAAFQGGYIHGADPEAGAQQIRRALRSKGLTSKEIEGYMATVVTSGATLLEKYRGISDKVENANRLSTYEAAIANGKSKRQAAYEAKDLMDYSLKGNFKLIGTMIDTLPFFNARLQGMSKLVRAAKASNDDRVLRVLSANLAMKGIKVAAFSLALAAMNDDDEEYQKLEDWDKDMNWHFFVDGEHMRIPKPFELGIIFGTMPERLFHYGTGTQTDKDLGKAVANAVWNTMSMNPIPQMFLPATEVLINKSFFKGSPIEGMADQNKQAEDRYSAYTSDTVKAIAQQFGVSPKKVEHLIKGYTGTIGGYVLGASDIVARMMTGKVPPETPVSRYPVVKAFYQGSGPKTNTKFATDFYDAMDAANQAYGSYKRAMELGDTKRQKELIEEHGKQLRSKSSLAKFQRVISKLRKMQQAINDNKTLSGTQKREKLDDIQRNINAMYHKAYVSMNLGEW